MDRSLDKPKPTDTEFGARLLIEEYEQLLGDHEGTRLVDEPARPHRSFML